MTKCKITVVALCFLLVANVPAVVCSVKPQQVQRERSYRIFEEYNLTMNSNQIRERLDALAEYLTATPYLHAYIVSYGGMQSCPNEALLRARASLRYLTNVKHIDARHLHILNRGYRDKWAVELWTGEPGFTVPPAIRTINKRKVTIMKNCDSTAMSF